MNQELRVNNIGRTAQKSKIKSQNFNSKLANFELIVKVLSSVALLASSFGRSKFWVLSYQTGGLN